MGKEVKYLLRKSNYSKGDRHMRNARYHDDRPTKNTKKGRVDPEYMPQREGMGSTRGGNWTNAVDTILVKRWLYSQVGKDFDHVYSEFLKRVQPKYLTNYKECIYWYVVRKKMVFMKDGEPWLKEEYTQHQRKMGTNRWERFFIHPDTNKLEVTSKYVRKEKNKNK